MTREFERAGLPIVHITNLIKISEGIGPRRIMKGNSVVHVLGDPAVPCESELKYRKRLVAQALDMLTVDPEEGTQYIVDNA